MADNDAPDLPAVDEFEKIIEIVGPIIPSQGRQALSRDTQLVAECQPDPPISKIKAKNPPRVIRHLVILQQGVARALAREGRLARLLGHVPAFGRETLETLGGTGTPEWTRSMACITM